MHLLTRVPAREGTRLAALQTGSSSDQQLLAQSQARQRSRLLTPLGSSWLRGPLARCLSCMLDYITARTVRGPL